jgi:hypothetical protein
MHITLVQDCQVQQREASGFASPISRAVSGISRLRRTRSHRTSANTTSLKRSTVL